MENQFSSIHILFFMVIQCSTSSTLMFHLPPNTVKCVGYQPHDFELVVGEYDITKIQGQNVTLNVTGGKGELMTVRKSASAGFFSFVTEKFEVFRVCVESLSIQKEMVGLEHEVYLFIKHGNEAKKYEVLEMAATFKGLEVEIRKLEDSVLEVKQRFSHVDKRLDQILSTNDSTDERLFYSSVLNSIWLLVVVSLQVYYLHSYFMKRNVICRK